MKAVGILAGGIIAFIGMRIVASSVDAVMAGDINRFAMGATATILGLCIGILSLRD